ncbi:hypothetical protein A3759_12155 [Thalassolituus sp. HI0120]|nr:hypothetical protein A3759_12155 [Thalassolituus sp. HI0120]
MSISIQLQKHKTYNKAIIGTLLLRFVLACLRHFAPKLHYVKSAPYSAVIFTEGNDMKFKIFSLIITLTLLSNYSNAKPVSRDNLTIKQIHPMAVDRTHCGESCSGITRIYVNSAVWGDTDCRQDAGDLYKEDDHILSTILFSWASGKNLRIEVNDQVKPIDSVCKITAISVF